MEWWVQDRLKQMQAFKNRFGIKKYYPHIQTFNPHYADPVFMDPTTALAANQSGDNMAMQYASVFDSNPGALAATYAGIQTPQQAANLISQYENQNVGIANQFNQANAATRNQADQYNLGLWDQYRARTATTNQQYDNAIRQAENEIVNMTANGLTNAAYTQGINSLYPQYDIHPELGGYMSFNNGYSPKPGTGKTAWESMVEDYKEAKIAYPDLKIEDFIKIYGESPKQDYPGMYPGNMYPFG